MVFGDEVEDDDGGFELVHDPVSPRHVQPQSTSQHALRHGSNPQPSLRSLRLASMERAGQKEGTNPEDDQVDNDGFLRFPGHETRRPQAGAPKTSQPAELGLGIDLNEQALTELAEEKGISKEELRSLLNASTASMAPSTSSASPAVTLRPAKRSSTPVQLLPAASSSSSSAMAMAPTQHRKVILAEESEEEKAEEPKEEATEPAGETNLEEVNQGAEPLVPVEKEKKYRRIRVKKSYPKIVTGVKRKATPASSSRVVLTREQRLERLRRLQHDRQERLEKIMKDDEAEAEDEEPKEKKAETEENLAAQQKKKGYSPKKRAFKISISKNPFAFNGKCSMHPERNGAPTRRSSSMWPPGAFL